MVNESESLFRPYAPPANMQAFMHRLRRMNMPPRITRDILKTAGISENIVPRLFATLRFLELITDTGEPTATLKGLAGSTEDEYRQLLERTLRTAYADDFESIDPSKDPQERIMNAIQRYNPRSQNSRQVMLFLGHCREAGIQTLDVPRRRGMRSRTPGQRPAGNSLQRSLQYPNGNDVQGTYRTNGQRLAQNVQIQFLGITLEDAALMPEEDFWDVWSAVGTVFLRREQRIYLTTKPDTTPQTEDEGFS